MNVIEEIRLISDEMKKDGVSVSVPDVDHIEVIKLGSRHVVSDDYPDFFASLNYMIKKYQTVEPEDIALYLLDFECI